MQDDTVSSISGARTLEEMADFWDTHSLADFDDQTYEVEMTFEPSARRSVVTIEPELMLDITQMARARNVSTQTLINVWLRQQVDRLMAQATPLEKSTT
ncbi:MAG: BrnA antitoxin family protein [Caldilineaceae bacterium]|nr:BrnA antitoxin family protein [Caldilineaceae bacterium]HRJ44144.1 CopG family antitoxin [Caldilineaceae bacterium]